MGILAFVTLGFVGSAGLMWLAHRLGYRADISFDLTHDDYMRQRGGGDSDDDDGDDDKPPWRPNPLVERN